MIKKLLFILLMVLVFSCEDDNDYSSIIGEWLVEDRGYVTTYRNYQVSIQRLPADSVSYTISNLYETGNTAKTVIQVDGHELIIREQMVGNYAIRGAGTISENYKKITIEYFVEGGNLPYEDQVNCEMRRE